MTWIRAADLARRCGISRAAVTQAIRNGRISPEAIQRQAGVVLVDLAAGLAAFGQQAPAPAVVAPAAPPTTGNDADGPLFAWGAPAPAAAVQQPQPDLARPVEGPLAAVVQREAVWLERYASFRRWVVSDFSGALMEQLPDQPTVFDAMGQARQLVLQQLQGLDVIEVASRFSVEQRNRSASAPDL